MRLSQTIDARHQQTQRIDPRQILASEILAWTTEELEVAIERELAENPALEARESEAFTLNAPVSEFPALTITVGGKQDDPPAPSERTQPTLQITEGGLDSEDPFDRVASNTSLREHLRSQVGQVKGDVSEEILRYLIENVDEA